MKSYNELLEHIEQLHKQLDFGDYSKLCSLISELMAESEATTSILIAAKVIKPKDPTNWQFGYSCPNCKSPILINRKYDFKNRHLDKYCRWCGQKFDWTEASPKGKL